MHLQTLSLLAVFTNIIVAGPVRKHGPFQNHQRFPRFYNITAEQQSQPPSPDTTTLSPLPASTESSSSSSSLFSSSASPESSLNHLSTLPPAAESSVPSAITAASSSESQQPASSVPAVSSANESPFSTAAVPGQELSSKLSSPIPSKVNTGPPTAEDSLTIFFPSFTGIAIPLTSSSAVTNSQEVVPTEVSTASPNPTSEAPTSLDTVSSGPSSSATSNFQSIPRPPASLSLTAISEGSFSTSTATPATGLDGQSSSTTQSDSLAVATASNQKFKSLSTNSNCDPNANKPGQFIACVEGQPATCEVDGRYTLQSCPDGQSCYALPFSDGQAGMRVMCAFPSDAAQKLAPATSPTSAVISPVQTSLPASTFVQGSESIGVASATANSASATITALNTIPANEDPQFQRLRVDTSSDPSPSLTEVSGESSLPNPSTSPTTGPIKGEQPGSHHQAAFTSEVKPIPAPSASPTDDSPLVLSFPSALATPTASIEHLSTPLNIIKPTAGLVANQKNVVPPAASFAAAELSASTASNAVNNVGANNAPVTAEENKGSPTAMTNSAGITIVPLGAEAGESNDGFTKTVTVTVTATVHDRLV